MSRLTYDGFEKFARAVSDMRAKSGKISDVGSLEVRDTSVSALSGKRLSDFSEFSFFQIAHPYHWIPGLAHDLIGAFDAEYQNQFTLVKHVFPFDIVSVRVFGGTLHGMETEVFSKWFKPWIELGRYVAGPDLWAIRGWSVGIQDPLARLEKAVTLGSDPVITVFAALNNVTTWMPETSPPGALPVRFVRTVADPALVAEASGKFDTPPTPEEYARRLAGNSHA